MLVGVNRSRAMLMAISSTLALSYAAPGLAQAPQPSTPAPDTAETTPEAGEIIVTGIRGSLREAIDVKRQANSFVDVINAEDIGKFPDKNVAESLSRIPGLGVSREFGEGERVVIRGTGTSQNRTLLNGQTVASTGWFTLDQPSRGFDFLILPSNLVSRLEVYKTPQADIQEGSLGGTISLRTRRPLESPANTVSIQARGQYSENADKFDPELSGLYSWKNNDETFGILASYTFQRRHVARTGREVIGFVNPTDNPSGVLLPRLIGETDFRQLRERRTFFGSAQWKPTDEIELLFNVMDTRFKANNINQNNLATIGSDGAILNVPSAQIVGTGPAAGVVAATIDATQGGAGARTQAFDRRSNIDGKVYDFQGTYTADRITLKVYGGRTTSEGGAPDERFYGFTSEGDRPAGATPGAINQLTFDRNLNVGFITATGPETDAQYLSRPFEFGNARSTVNTEEENYAGLDLTYDLDGDVFSRIKIGALYQDHGVGRRATLTGLHWFSDSQHISPTGGYAGANLRPGARAWLTFTPTGAVFGNATSLTVGDFSAGKRGEDYFLIDSALARSIGTPPAGTEVGTLDDYNGTWNLSEETFSGYVQTDFNTDRIRGNIGLRVTHTKLASSGFSVTGDAFGAAARASANFKILAEAFGCVAATDCVATPATESNSYTEFLPNFNIAFELSDQLLARFGAARTIARPNYEALALRESFFVNTLSGTRGNPELRPTVSNQIDAGLEWYFKPGSILAAAVFYKDITNNLITSLNTETRVNPDTNQPVEIQFSTPQNGQDAKIKGLEVSYQQNFGNFGTVVNYTYTDASTSQERDPIGRPNSGLVAGASKHIVNVIGFYEDERLSARIAYNYRSSFLNEIPYFGAEIATEGFSQLDFSGGYRLTDWAELSVEAINLLNSKTRSYNQIPERAELIYTNDRRFLAGVNLRF